MRFTEPDPRTMRGGTFRLLTGVHWGNCPPGCTCLEGYKKLDHVYEAYEAYFNRMTVANKGKLEGNCEPILPQSEYRNDIIEDKSDLVKLHNFGIHSRKFERIKTGDPVLTTDADRLAQLEAEAAAIRARLAATEPVTVPADAVTEEESSPAKAKARR